MRVRLIAPASLPNFHYRHNGKSWCPDLKLAGGFECLKLLSFCFHQSHPPFLHTSQFLSFALFPRTCLCLPVTQTRLVIPINKYSYTILTCPSSSYHPYITLFVPITTLPNILSFAISVNTNSLQHGAVAFYIRFIFQGISLFTL